MTRITILACASMVAGCGGRPSPTPAVPRAVIEPAPRPKPTYEADVAPTIERDCLACHGPSTKRGGISLERPDVETWARVADALRAGTMPPTGRPRPSSAEIAVLVEWLDAEVFGCSSPDPGRVTMRRLNRAEYDHTIRDLIGLDLHLADAFPADDVGYGFDKIGDVLSIPPLLIEKYLAAADRAVDEAARDPRAWSRILNPAPDSIPLALRKPTFETRSEPIKRIGRPSTAPIVETPEGLALRRARDILRGFADRAYRRPASAEELTRLVGLFESANKDGDSFDAAIRHALKAVLISPGFLFLVEEEGSDESQGTSIPVGECELASRLSYFLWSSMPDVELSQLAAKGELRRGETLARQARRMLRDEKARALVEGFAAQWLQIRSLKDITPDPGQFPDFDEPLRQAMLGETLRFAGAILLEDGRVTDFLDAEYSFVNERLARHYGIPGVVGDHFRRVSLAGTGRVGVLTQASVLTVTSNPTRTSPVKRGKWVLDNLLGHAAAPSARGRRGPEGRGGRQSIGDPPPADGAAPRRPELRLVPRPDGPPRLCPREFRCDRPLA